MIRATCALCSRAGGFAELGFTYLRRPSFVSEPGTTAELVPACGRCARRQFSVGPPPVVMRWHDLNAWRAA